MSTRKRRETPPGAPKYRRLTEEKRITIETLRKEGGKAHGREGRLPPHDGLAGAEAQRRQERLPAREGAGQGEPPRRGEGREEAPVHAGDVGAGDGVPEDPGVRHYQESGIIRNFRRGLMF